jgi:hypothetical protein
MSFYQKEEYKSFFELIDNDFYLKFTKKQFPEGNKKYKNISIKKLASEDLREGSFNKEYKSVDITYSFDKYGYRIYPKLNRPTSKNIFCFGCSYTFGHGIPDEHTWPYILAKKLGEDYTPHNYGVSATSFKSMGRRLYQVLNSNPIKPDHIFLFLPTIFTSLSLLQQLYHQAFQKFRLHFLIIPFFILKFHAVIPLPLAPLRQYQMRLDLQLDPLEIY